MYITASYYASHQVYTSSAMTPWFQLDAVNSNIFLVHPSCRVVWVLKELEPENWVHNGGTDFAVQLKAPSAADVLGKVLTAEGTYTHWSLFNRFILANEILDAADSAGRD